MRWRFTLDSASSGTLVLADEPIGWADVVQTFRRDKDWHGIFFDFTLSLKFWGAGYRYIKNIYDTVGIDEYVELFVEIACSDTDAFEEFYIGKLLMAKYKETVADDCTAEVPVDPAGCLMQFRNRIDQAVDLDANEDFDSNPLTPYTGLGFDITLLPKTLVRRTIGFADDTNPCTDLSYTDTNGRQITSGTGSQSMTDVAYFNIPYNNYSLTEINTVNSLCTSYASTPGAIDILLDCTEPGNYTFQYAFQLFLQSAAVFRTPFGVNEPDCWTGSSQPEYYVFEDWKVEIQAYRNASLVYQSTLINSTGSCTSNLASAPWGKQNVFTDSNSFTIACAVGDAVRMCVQITIAGSWQRSLLLNNDILFNHNLDYTIGNTITIKAEELQPPTDCRVYLINEALSRVTEAITDDCLRVYSDYFGRTDAQPYTSASDGCGSLEVIMKGLHVRQFPAADVLMSVSFKDLFESLNSIHCIGIGIEPDPNRPGSDMLRIEPLSYWYDDSTIILDCDLVPEIRHSATPDTYVSVFQFGYEKWEAEDSMGLDEFCTKREFRSTRREIKNTLNKQCKFIASGYALEVTRNKHYTVDSTKDWRWDDDTFLLCVRRDSGNIVVEQGVDCVNTSTMTDIIDPATVYNYRISPIRNLMRWSRYLFATYFPTPTGPDAKFIFSTGEGNFIVKGTLTTGCFQEAAETAEDDTIDSNSFTDPDDATPIFCPALDEFEYPVAWQTVRLWRTNPSVLRGAIRYRRYASDPWREGYITQLEYKPNEGIATFTVLPKF